MSFFNSIIDSVSKKQPQLNEIPKGDPVRGKKVFQNNCADCHYVKRIDDSDLQAPTLAGLIGRKTGSTGFKASKSLRRANFKWTEEHLFKFLRHPQKYIPGNVMVWPGMKGAQQRADLVAYIKLH